MVKILIIEDHKDLRDDVIEMLHLEGYEAYGAEDGQDGISVAKEQIPDLIVCDIMMPGMNGIQVLTEIRKDPSFRTTPVVMLTAQGDTNLIMQAQELNATDFMTKPFEVKEILALIRQYVA